MKEKHLRQHIICWKFTSGEQVTYHMQNYYTKEIAMDKRDQLLSDRVHVHPADILYRCVVFKFTA